MIFSFANLYYYNEFGEYLTFYLGCENINKIKIEYYEGNTLYFAKQYNNYLESKEDIKKLPQKSKFILRKYLIKL